MVRKAVLIQITRVTDGRTDGIGVAYTALSIASRGKNDRSIDQSLNQLFSQPIDQLNRIYLCGAICSERIIAVIYQ